MIPKLMDNAGLEAVYDALSEALDRAGEARHVLFLAKLSLTLANLVGDPQKVNEAIAACLRDLHAEAESSSSR